MRRRQAVDMLVRLYDLPERDRYTASVESLAISIRRARSYEKGQVLDWLTARFSRGWAEECSVAFARDPISCFIAVHEGRIVGFVAYEVTCRNFAGPIGIDPAFRGTQLCHALVCRVLHAMTDMGYAYAILGGLKDLAPLVTRYFKAIEIPGSTPGIYTTRLVGADS